MFRIESGINVVHVPYKALTQALTELVSGQLQLMFVVSTAAVPQLTAGRIRGLAVTSLRRSAVTPDIPTLDELGMRGFEATGWYGILAPAGTPAAITAKLNEEIVKALRMPDVAQRLTSLGLDQVGSSQKEFGDLVKLELAKWASVVKTAGIRVE
jgi:tripartite-type tricarboxylate transporter receptor subunit TctC